MKLRLIGAQLEGELILLDGFVGCLTQMVALRA